MTGIMKTEATHVLVPREPTDAQLRAGAAAWLADPMRLSSTLYRAMVAAAPITPSTVPADLRAEAALLLARLEVFEVDGLASVEAAREWHGHVRPYMFRLRTALASTPPAPADAAEPAEAGASEWQDLSAAEIVRRVRCGADDQPGDTKTWRACCDTILRRLPPSADAAASREGPAFGWLFHNPDTGTEWSEDHPVESGEVHDAEDIRPATLLALRDEMHAAWTALAEIERARDLAALTPAKPDPAGREEIAGIIHDHLCVREGTLPWTKITKFRNYRDGYAGKRALTIANAILAARPAADPGAMGGWQPHPVGSRVRKISGSSWQGRVVGHYSTALTPEGVCVESEREPGSVQIYPAKALVAITPSTDTAAPGAESAGRDA